MILLLDNFDSFTFNLVDYFHQLEVECRVIRNDIDPVRIADLDVKALVISPGPETPERSGNLMQVLDHYHNKVPVLGICLGHQAIGQYFGGRIEKAQKPMHGKISNIRVEKDALFHGLPSRFKVVRYNSLIVELCDGPIKPIARSDEGELMALRHVRLPVWGVQFHPEAALTEYGLQLLKNWLSSNRIAR